MDKLNIRKLVVGQMQTNCYLVSDEKTRKAVIIDPGDDGDFIQNQMRDWQLKPIGIIATHGHFDHNLAAFELQSSYQIPFYIQKKDKFLLDNLEKSAKFYLSTNESIISPKNISYLDSNSVINIGNYKLFVIETPGHTPGSICLYDEDKHILITGDTIFAHGDVGRTDFSYSSQKQLVKSIKLLVKLFGDKTHLYPGHGETCLLFQTKKLLTL